MLAFCGAPFSGLSTFRNGFSTLPKKPLQVCRRVRQGRLSSQTLMANLNDGNEKEREQKSDNPMKWMAYAATAIILSSISLSPLNSDIVHASPMNSAPLRFKQSLLLEDEGGPVKLRAQWDVKSIDSKTETFLMFSNDSSSVVDLWWIDYFGHEVYYASINPGTTHIQPSFATHPWVIRDHISQNSLLVLVAEAQPALAIVNNI